MRIQAMGKRYTILLIDPDAKEYCEDLGSTFQDCIVIVEKSKQKACEFFFHNDVDLVLLGHTPHDPCTNLLQDLSFVAPSIPIIITTTYSSEEFAVNIFKCGAYDYLKKPFNEDELRECIQTALGRKESLDDRSPTHSKAGLHRAFQYINANYCTPLKLARVAKEAGMSVSCLERTFKKTLNVTFSIYVNKLRIARAIQMLEEGIELSINEIAFACGFTNQYHFTRMFKKITKLCPRDFRKALTEIGFPTQRPAPPSLISSHFTPKNQKISKKRQNRSPNQGWRTL
jgi:YesN/AraC family two-component response regulator